MGAHMCSCSVSIPFRPVQVEEESFYDGSETPHAPAAARTAKLVLYPALASHPSLNVTRSGPNRAAHVRVGDVGGGTKPHCITHICGNTSLLHTAHKPPICFILSKHGNEGAHKLEMLSTSPCTSLAPPAHHAYLCTHTAKIPCCTFHSALEFFGWQPLHFCHPN